MSKFAVHIPDRYVHQKNPAIHQENGIIIILNCFKCKIIQTGFFVDGEKKKWRALLHNRVHCSKQIIPVSEPLKIRVRENNIADIFIGLITIV
jgi:hypothetical protein